MNPQRLHWHDTPLQPNMENHPMNEKGCPPKYKKLPMENDTWGVQGQKILDNIPGYEDCGQCPDCEQTEDMNHILFICPLNHGKALWLAAKNLSKWKRIPWPQDMDHTYVMAAPLIKIRNWAGKMRSGASRLCTIIILECAWQTWKVSVIGQIIFLYSIWAPYHVTWLPSRPLLFLLLYKHSSPTQDTYYHWVIIVRCRRIIGNDQESTPIAIKKAFNNLRSALTNKLQEDVLLTNQRRYGKKAYPKSLILSTWSRVLDNEDSLPQNWLFCSKVLVGIPDPPGESHMWQRVNQVHKAFPHGEVPQPLPH